MELVRRASHYSDSDLEELEDDFTDMNISDTDSPAYDLPKLPAEALLHPSSSDDPAESNRGEELGGTSNARQTNRFRRTLGL